MAVRERGSEADAPKRGRGRPRSHECHSAILAATVELLDERKYTGVTMESVAERASVSKQTVYKWWPSKARLVMEASLARADQDIPDVDSGSVVKDLERFLLATCRLLSERLTGPTVAGLIAEAQSDPEVARELRDTFIAGRRAKCARIVERGIARGELRKGIDIPFVLDLFYGPIWYRLLLKNGPLDARFARAIVHSIVPAFTVPRKR
ncbi:MAG: TetR/AcrR family transcriptional regulator [Polyangiaceae bacterium]